MHIAAIGVGSMIFNFIYWNFGFLRMGTTGMTAQSYGAEDLPGQSRILFQSVLLSFGISVLLLLMSIPIINLSGFLFQLGEQESAIVRTYFLIRIWDAPATLILFGIMGWLFGMQNAMYPLIITIVVNVINIAISYMLVVQYDFNIQGVAIGTVIAQYFGVIIGAILIYYRYPSEFKRAFTDMSFRWPALQQFMKVNVDLFLRTLCLTASFAIFYSQSSAAGTMILAVNVIILLFVNWMSYIIDGFAYAAESLVGKFKGASAHKNLDQFILRIFTWSAGMAILISVIYGIFGVEIANIFTDQQEVVVEVSKYRIWYILFPVLAFTCYIWDGVFIGLTAVRSMRNAMLLSFGVFLILIFNVGSTYGNHGLWAALLVLMLLRGAIQTWMWCRNGSQLV